MNTPPTFSPSYTYTPEEFAKINGEFMHQAYLKCLEYDRTLEPNPVLAGVIRYIYSIISIRSNPPTPSYQESLRMNAEFSSIKLSESQIEMVVAVAKEGYIQSLETELSIINSQELDWNPQVKTVDTDNWVTLDEPGNSELQGQYTEHPYFSTNIKNSNKIIKILELKYDISSVERTGSSHGLLNLTPVDRYKSVKDDKEFIFFICPYGDMNTMV